MLVLGKKGAEIRLILFLSSHKHSDVFRNGRWVFESLTWFVNEHHTANKNNHTYSKNKLNLFRATVLFPEMRTFAAFPCLFHHHNICVHGYIQRFVFLSFSKWWRAFRFRFIWKPFGRKRTHTHYALTGTLVLRFKFYKYTYSSILNPIWSNWSIYTFSTFLLYFTMYSTNTLHFIWNCLSYRYSNYICFSNFI